MNIICQFCESHNFLSERPEDKKFTACCHKGKVKLPNTDFPEYLKNIMSEPDFPNYQNFKQHIRSYNSAISFVSMGAKIVQAPGFGIIHEDRTTT